MHQEQFCRGVYQLAVDEAVAAEVRSLKRPPGGDLSPALHEISPWFRGLSPEDRRLAVETLRWGAEAGVYGVLAILDGVRPLRGSRGELTDFELFAEDGDRSLLNDPELEMLHDVFSDVVGQARSGR